MKCIGGNSGYIGYSESVRSRDAKREGRYPKTLFKKQYGISEKQFKMLEERGVIYVSEWHHTSKFGNKTSFWAICDYVLFFLLIGDKKEAFKRYKSTRNYEAKIVYNKPMKSANNRAKWEKMKRKEEGKKIFKENKKLLEDGAILCFKTKRKLYTLERVTDDFVEVSCKGVICNCGDLIRDLGVIGFVAKFKPVFN